MRRTEKKLRRFTISQGGCHRWFSEILQKPTRGSFFTPWSQVGGQFSLCPYSHRNTGGSKWGYTQILRRKTKNKSPRKK